MTVQVPHGAYAVTQPQDVPSTPLGYAVVFTLLTAAALAASSLHTWACYSIGCQIAGGGVARWKTLGIMAFLLVFVGAWFGSHVQTQANLRRLDFEEMFSTCFFLCGERTGEAAAWAERCYD